MRKSISGNAQDREYIARGLGGERESERETGVLCRWREARRRPGGYDEKGKPSVLYRVLDTRLSFTFLSFCAVARVLRPLSS
jgi:hypothetical protein